VNAIVDMASVNQISRVPLDPTRVVRGVEVWRPPRIARNLDRASDGVGRPVPPSKAWPTPHHPSHRPGLHRIVWRQVGA
jgi:hypothetical protein